MKSILQSYAPVNGLKLYYEIHGQGEPVVLLHGACMSLEGPMREPARQPARDIQVIAPEMQGHGRTNDIVPLTRAFFNQR